MNPGLSWDQAHPTLPMGAVLSRLWICTLQEWWGLISKLDGACNPMLLSPDPRHFRQNAAKHVRSVGNSLPEWQAGCWSPRTLASCISWEAKMLLSGSLSQSSHIKVQSATITQRGRFWLIQTEEHPCLAGHPARLYPTPALHGYGSSWEREMEFIFFSLFSIPLFFLFAFPLRPQGTEW